MKTIDYINEAMILNESNELAQGIFWIVDVDNYYSNIDYCIPIYSNPDGTLINPEKYDLNAKSGITFNHEKYWNNMPRKYTHGEKFNYYPRGRVQISNGKATIYANPNICNEELRQFIIEQFGLYKIRGINKVVIIPDGSEHYKCYLDY